MPSKLIAADDCANNLIVNGDAPANNTYFRLLKLDVGQTEEFQLENFECLAVVLSGTADITVSGMPADIAEVSSSAI